MTKISVKCPNQKENKTKYLTSLVIYTKSGVRAEPTNIKVDTF